MIQRAVFLDRDGVLNQAMERGGKPFPPASGVEVVIPLEVPAACAALRAAGYRLIIVTNQPDVARGTTTRDQVESINTLVAHTAGVDQIITCYEDGQHPDRKPNPGMLLRAIAEHQLDPAECWIVGDRFSDILAGERAGVRTILIGHGWDEPDRGARPNHRAGTFADAAAHILAHPR